MAEEIASSEHSFGSNTSHSLETRNRQLRSSLRSASEVDAICNAPVLHSTLDNAVIHFTIAIRAARIQAQDALDTAIEALKNLDITTVLKAAMVWVKSHPWETTALAIPLLLTLCTPAFLGFAGFTLGGVATGLNFDIHLDRPVIDIRIGSIAAGIQAGIGSVGAGSIFAALTSAAMSGYGATIVFGSVGGISSVVCWEVATWRKWKQDPDYVDGAGHGRNHSDVEGTEDTKSRSRSLEQ